jgi:MoaA/NifB/PqqE/SkfB family radical SAM enzyme
MAPWIQLHAQTNGTIAPCCMSSIHGGNELGNLRENAQIEDAWNSKNMKTLRQNMLSGKQSSICTHCYNYEKVGKYSERQQYNRDFKMYFSRIKETADNGSLKTVDIPLLDVRFSNKCNYKCRICDSVYSSLWYDEEQKTGKKPGLPSSKEMKMVTDEEVFWASFRKLMPGVKRLHFAGGEPLFMDEHYRTLEHLIETGNTDVVLSYNSNFSILRYKQYNVVELWNHFKRVEVWASLDLMGDKGDYQRKGQKWNKVEENIRTLQVECPSVFFGINVTVSILNVLDVPDFYKYMVQNKLVLPERMNLYLLFDPSYLNITNLPLKLKQEVVKRFENLEKSFLSTLPNTQNIRNHIQAVNAYMLSAQGKEQANFKHWITTIDNLRNESFAETFPELAELIK